MTPYYFDMKRRGGPRVHSTFLIECLFLYLIIIYLLLDKISNDTLFRA
jgi:hypothetical protein